MDTMMRLIGDYGSAVYIILFLYSALKNGALPLFGGYAAQQGMLDPVLVALVACTGGYLGDELRFAIARRYGAAMFSARPRIASWLKRSENLLQRYGVLYIFLYRYPIGMRTIGALPLGLTNITWRKFTVLSAASAIIWAVVFVSVGYAFGGVFESALAKGWKAMSVSLLVIAVVLLYFGFQKASKKA